MKILYVGTFLNFQMMQITQPTRHNQLNFNYIVNEPKDVSARLVPDLCDSILDM